MGSSVSSVTEQLVLNRTIKREKQWGLSLVSKIKAEELNVLRAMSKETVGTFRLPLPWAFILEGVDEVDDDGRVKNFAFNRNAIGMRFLDYTPTLLADSIYGVDELMLNKQEMKQDTENAFLGIRVLPTSLGNLTGLCQLALDTVGMTALPSSISNLKKLRMLSLSSCVRLETLPASIGSLTALERLYLMNSRNLTSLPEECGDLVNLQKLILAGCRALTALPSNLGALKKLNNLDLGKCRSLTSLPESIGGLESLVELYMWGCDSLTALPGSFSQLSRLKVLNLEDCSKLKGSVPESVLAQEGCQDVSQYPLRLVPRDEILRLQRFPSHEEILAKTASTMFSRDVMEFTDGFDSMRTLQALFEEPWLQWPLSTADAKERGMAGWKYMYGPVKRDMIMFVSHRWLTPHIDPALAHPDTPDNSKLKHLQAFLQAHSKIQFVFMDFMCIPQHDRRSQLLAINSLPYYIRNCGHFVVLASDEANFEEYKCRGWCQLERLTAVCPYPVFSSATFDHSTVSPRVEGQWKRETVSVVSLWHGGTREERDLPMALEEANFPVDGLLTSENDRRSIALVSKTIAEECILAAPVVSALNEQIAKDFLQRADDYLISHLPQS